MKKIKKMFSILILLLTLSLFFSVLHYSFAITYVDKFMIYQSAEETEKETEFVKERVKEIVDELGIREVEEHRQILRVVDWIHSNVKYDKTKNEELRSSYDALYYGETVCTGYSMLFYRFMEELNIPCEIISCVIREGKVPHAINLVQIEEKWYFIDTTNFDSTSTYFLCGLNRINNIFYIYDNIYQYSYCKPDLENISKEDYKYQNNNNNTNNNNFNSVKNNIHSIMKQIASAAVEIKKGLYYDNPSDGTFNTNGYTSSEYLQRDYYIVKYGVTLKEMGYIEGETYQEVKEGGKTTKVKAVALPGYRFIAWCDGRKNPVRYDRNVKEDINVWAIFEKI